jgi:hypothetical protein
VRDPLWRRARAVPSLDLRFADNKSLVDAVTGASLVTFTRASSGTYVDSAGVIQTAATDVPRFDHNPTTGESLGLLVEEQGTNLLLNSATLSTQSVTVAAAANTLSFYGTGTVTLTGVSTAGPLVGTGANDRVSLTFTPIVGVLVLTVSGSVTNAQLEAASTPSSYIPTTTAAVTRSADVASITGSAFSSWYRQDEGTVFAEGRNNNTSGSPQIARLRNSADTAFRLDLFRASSASRGAFFVSDSTTQANLTNAPAGIWPINSKTAICAAYRQDNFAVATNGSALAIDTSGTVPASIDLLSIGNQYTGTISRITYWPQALPSQLQSLTQ